MKLFKSSRLKVVNNILFQTDFRGRKLGFIQSWNLLSNFPVLEKVWKIEIKSGEKLQQLLYKWNFFLLVKSYSILPVRLQRIIDKALFLLFFLRSLAHLFDKWESGKRSYCFGKSLEKILNFGSKNMCKPCKERLSYKCHYLMLTPLSRLECSIPW